MLDVCCKPPVISREDSFWAMQHTKNPHHHMIIMMFACMYVWPPSLPNRKCLFLSPCPTYYYAFFCPVPQQGLYKYGTDESLPLLLWRLTERQTDVSRMVQFLPFSRTKRPKLDGPDAMCRDLSGADRLPYKHYGRSLSLSAVSFWSRPPPVGNLPGRK